MTKNEEALKANKINCSELEFEGVYGRYRITHSDQVEVQRYRLSLLVCGLAFCIGLGHWLLIGPSWAWVWMIPMAAGLGLALKWIHIYLRPLHKTLQIFWALGCIGLIVAIVNLGADEMLSSLVKQPIWTIAIGPFFAALTGLGFKEFFCFQRIEAIGLTLLVPITILGHLSGIFSGTIVMSLLSCSALLLLIMAIRKFGMDASADIGDKSVFDFLEGKEKVTAL